MITFYCSNCGTKISAEPEYGGAAASCPTCGHDLVVPSSPAEHGVEIEEPSASSRAESMSTTKGSTGRIARWFGGKTTKLAIASIILFLSVVLIHSWVKKPNDLLDPDDPLYNTYKKAGIWHTVYRKNVGGEFLYMGKSDKPFTGWVKMPRTEGSMSRGLIHFTNGRMDKEWRWYDNGQLWREITFDPNKPDTVDVTPTISPKRVTGVLSLRQWTKDGDLCARTKVIDGNGEGISYNADGREAGVDTYSNGFVTEKKRPAYSMSSNWEMNLSKEELESSPIYTQGYNKGREEAIRGEIINANPYNELSEKKNWYIWSRGYSVGKLSVRVERSLLK